MSAEEARTGVKRGGSARQARGAQAAEVQATVQKDAQQVLAARWRGGETQHPRESKCAKQKVQQRRCGRRAEIPGRRQAKVLKLFQERFGGENAAQQAAAGKPETRVKRRQSSLGRQ